MKYKKILPYIIGGALVVGGCAPDEKYVVTAKVDEKIVYENCHNRPARRVLLFKDPGTFTSSDIRQANKDIYKLIQIGDTIEGGPLDNHMVSHNIYDGLFGEKFCRIHKINGKTIDELRSVAERDSIIATMNQKTK